jgi:hypothetical protein
MLLFRDLDFVKVGILDVVLGVFVLVLRLLLASGATSELLVRT